MREKIQKALFDWNKSVVKDLASDDVCRLPEYALQLSRIIAFPELDVRNEISKIDQIGLKIRKTLENFSQSRPTQIIERINDQLYRKEKFRPNRDDYYNPSNSFLNVVIRRKIGIPITLSIVYMRVAESLDFKLVPVSFPSHFLIKYILEGESEIIIDPYNEGRIMDDYSLKQLLDQTAPRLSVALTRDFVARASVTKVMIRMLNNLKTSYFECQDIDKAELVNEMILHIHSNDQYGLRDKGMIMLKRKYQQEALELFNQYIEKYPEADDIDPILELVRKLKKNQGRET
ncbi:MAG TPA: transglutaminase-like domain-containing protein [Nitrososphaeraceae archaeon]|jgi:regulator of sirC expression with transglutaminase-like and TPR domain|nr:transglutaminase-like domain-containing protein [Nitrososphaeraceae archaeon]